MQIHGLRWTSALIVSWLALTTASVATAQCLGLNSPDEVGAIVNDNAADVTVVGSLAYVADAADGLRIIDVSNPTSPTSKGSFVTAESAVKVAVSGSMAYVSTGTGGLRVIDVSDPNQPIEVGFEPTNDFVQAAAIQGNYAYVADEFDGLRVVDVSDPTLPVEIDSVATPDAAVDVAVAGSHAYVAASFAGMRVIDISNPSNAAEIGSFPASSETLALTVVGSLAYLADDNDGLRIIDISNPTTPIEIGFIDTPGQTNDVEVIGSVAYLAANTSGVRLIDVSDPTTPVEIGSFASGQARGLALGGAYVYVADGLSGLRIVASGTAQLASEPTTNVLAMQVQSTDMFVAAGPSGLRIFDLGFFPSVFPLGSIGTSDLAFGLHVVGNVAYVADGFAGLTTWNVSNTSTPTFLGSVNPPGGDARAVEVVGNIAYLADGDAGLRTIDVTNSAGPVALDVIDTPGFAEDVKVVGSVAYVADGTSGIRLIDVADPDNLSLLGSLDTPGVAHQLEVAGSRVYLADGSGGLRVIDVGNPAAPVELGFSRAPIEAADVEIVGATAYVSDQSVGLRVIDVSNPADPVQVAIEVVSGVNATGLASEGSLAWIGDLNFGFRGINTDCHPIPVPIAHYDFNETGNAPGSKGMDRRPIKTKNDGGTSLDLHTADADGVSGFPGDRAFDNTGASAHGAQASAATNGVRAEQTSDNDAFDALQAFTISGWFKTETTASVAGATPRLVHNHNNLAGASGAGFNLQFQSATDGDLKLEVDDDTGGGVSSTGTAYDKKQTWTFFAVTYDGSQSTSNVRFYVGYRNDAEAGGGPGSAAVRLVSTHSLDRGATDDETVGLRVGNRGSGDRPFDGFLDDIRIDPSSLGGTFAQRTLEGYRQESLRNSGAHRVEYVDTTTVATSAQDQTATTVTVDELSGVTYDAAADRFWAVSDGRGRLLEIDVDFATNGGFSTATASSALSLANNLDFEGIAFTNTGQNSVFLADEGGATVGEYNLANGNFIQNAAVPALYPSSDRNNRSLEALARREGAEMLMGVEQALTVDGPDGTSTTVPTVSRWQRFNAANAATNQVAYRVEPVHGATVGSTGSSLSDMLLMPDGSVLALERSEADGEFLTRIFQVQAVGGTDVSGGLAATGLIGLDYMPISKTLLYSDDSLGKVEGLVLGPQLMGGGQAILAVEDGTSNVIHSFAVRPVPEPGAGSMLGMGALVGVALASRSRRRR